MGRLLEWQTLEYLEFSSIGYYFGFLFKLIISSGAIHAAAWAAAALAIGVAFAFISLILLPRVVEDYIKLYNWYVNSDFYFLFREKVDIRLIFRLLLLPFALVFSLIFFVTNIAVKTALDLAYRLDLLRCVNCGSHLHWAEGTVICHICGDKVVGSATQTCPGCHFKPNAVRCPYCGFVVFLGLHGEHQSTKAGKRDGSC